MTHLILGEREAHGQRWRMQRITNLARCTINYIYIIQQYIFNINEGGMGRVTHGWARSMGDTTTMEGELGRCFWWRHAQGTGLRCRWKEVPQMKWGGCVWMRRRLD